MSSTSISKAGVLGIDGLILTKFDTIDDKVGAAISMAHKSGQPIFFVGTGQKYTKSLFLHGLNGIERNFLANTFK